MSQIKIAIGVPTYNDYERITNLFTTLTLFTDFPEEDYRLVMLDDGTKNQEKVEKLKVLSESLDIPLIINKENRGIPYSWNRLAEYYDAEYVILFNDDIQIKASNWLKNFVYFMDNNPQAGAAGFPLVHIDPATGRRNELLDLPNERVNPGRVGAPVGCAFGFRKKAWSSIVQPDGTIGFWEDLVSFYEETDFGFSLANLGYTSHMLPTPSVEHWGSQTFSKNRELSVRKISNLSYIGKDGYLSIMSRGNAPALPIEEHISKAEEGLAYRMDYSRVMFAKKWECDDLWNTPQVELHKRIIDKMQPSNVKWMDIDGVEREAVV